MINGTCFANKISINLKLSQSEIKILHEFNPNPIHLYHTWNAVAAGFP